MTDFDQPVSTRSTRRGHAGRRRTRLHSLAAGLACLVLLAAAAPETTAAASCAQDSDASDVLSDGLVVKKRDVLWGNAHRSKAPAEIDLQAAIEATPEGLQIEEEGIEKGSARYDILMAKAHARVRQVVRATAIAEGRDCVVKSGSYRNPEGLDVVDLTAKVIEALESEV